METTVDAEQEEELEVSITFSELQCLDCDDLSTCVSKQNALKICKSSLEKLSTTTVNVLSLWLRKLLRAYSSEGDFCMNVFKCLYEWCLQLKENVTSGDKKACEDFITLLADALSFAEWSTQHLLTEVACRLAAILLLGIVYSCLQLINEHNVETLKEHEPKAIDLHLNALFLLEKTLSTSKTIHPQISPLVRQLVDIADFLNVEMRQLHVLVKTSKAITKICTHFAQCDMVGKNKLTMADLQEETIMHLCDTILIQLDTVHRDDILSVPVDKTEEYLKVAQVYLIMLHKVLCCDIKRIDASVLKDIVQVLNLGETKPTCDLGQELPKFIGKYVRPYTLHIFEMLYQHKDFQKYLIAWLSECIKLDVDYSELCLGYITAIIIDHTEIDQLTCQTVQKTFEYLFKDAFIFTNTERYNRILEAFGTLLYVACSVSLINYFSTGLFQEDIIKSQVCADILMLLFRLEETTQSWNKNDIEQATKYWIKCNNSYAMFSQNLSQFHVQRMLKYFHKLGSHEMPIFNIRNYRYLHCVSSRTQTRPLGLRLKRLIEVPLSSIEQYYEIMSLMELLLSGGDAEFLTYVWKQVKETTLRNKCKLLANTFYKMALQFSPADKLCILQTAKALPEKSVADSCWYVQKFLHACKSSENTKIKSLAEQHTIDTKLLALLDALQSEAVNKPTTNKFQYINYKLNYRRQLKHYCNLNTLKRKRTHVEPKELIQQIDQNLQQMIQCSDKLKPTDVVQLRSIVDKLNLILSAH